MLPNRKAELSETSAVLEAFKFIENAAAEFSDEEEEEDSEGRDRTNVESRTVRKPSALTVCSHPKFFTRLIPISCPPDPEKEAVLLIVPRQYGHH